MQTASAPTTVTTRVQLTDDEQRQLMELVYAVNADGYVCSALEVINMFNVTSPIDVNDYNRLVSDIWSLHEVCAAAAQKRKRADPTKPATGELSLGQLTSLVRGIVARVGRSQTDAVHQAVRAAINVFHTSTSGVPITTATTPFSMPSQDRDRSPDSPPFKRRRVQARHLLTANGVSALTLVACQPGTPLRTLLLLCSFSSELRKRTMAQPEAWTCLSGLTTHGLHALSSLLSRSRGKDLRVDLVFSSAEQVPTALAALSEDGHSVVALTLSSNVDLVKARPAFDKYFGRPKPDLRSFTLRCMGLSGVLTAKLFKLEFLECSMHQIGDIANFPSITHFIALAPRTPPGEAPALDQFLFARLAKTFPQLQSLVTERWFDDLQRAQESHPTLRSFSAKASASSGLNIYDRDDIVRHNLKVVHAESIPTLVLYGDVEEMVKSSNEHLGPDLTSVAFVMHENQLHLYLDSERRNVDAVDFPRSFRRIVANAGPCQSRQLVAILDNYHRLTKLSVSFKLMPHQVRTLFCSRPRVLTTLELLLDPHANSKGTVDVLTYDTDNRKWALPSTLRTFRLTAVPALAPELRTSYSQEGYEDSLVIPTVSAGHVDRFIHRNAETHAINLTVELVRVAFKQGREHADMQALKKRVKKLIVNGMPL